MAETPESGKIDELVKSVNGLTEHLKKQSSKTATKKRDTQAGSIIGKGIKKLLLPAMGFSLGAVIVKSFSSAFSSWTSLASFGISVDALRKSNENDTSIKISDTTATKFLTRAVNAGIVSTKNYGGALSTLTKRTHFTGQSIDALFGSISLLVGETGMSRKSINDLADSISDTSDTYEIQTTTLADMLSRLSVQMGGFAALGIDQSILGAAEKIAGQAGPAFKNNVTSLIKLMTDGSAEGIRKQALLGVSQESKALSRAKTSAEAEKILLSALSKSSSNAMRMLSGFTGGLNDFIGVDILKRIAGNNITQMIALDKRLKSGEMVTRKGVEKQEASTNWTHSIFLVLDEYLHLISDAVLTQMPLILKSIKTAVEWAKDWFKTAFPPLWKKLTLKANDIWEQVVIVASGISKIIGWMAVLFNFISRDKPPKPEKVMEWRANNQAKGMPETLKALKRKRDKVGLTPSEQFLLKINETSITNHREAMDKLEEQNRGINSLVGNSKKQIKTTKQVGK